MSFEYFVGLDLSLTGTGLVVINKDHEIVEQRLISTKPGDFALPEERLLNIRDTISSYLIPYNPKLVFMEGISYGSRGQAMFDLSGLNFIIRELLYSNKISYFVIPPKQMKKWATGNGNADKKEVMRTCKEKFGVEFKNDNLADAYCFSRYACFYSINPFDITINKKKKKHKKKRGKSL